MKFGRVYSGLRSFLRIYRIRLEVFYNFVNKMKHTEILRNAVRIGTMPLPNGECFGEGVVRNTVPGKSKNLTDETLNN